jgi:hypothetical protein
MTSAAPARWAWSTRPRTASSGARSRCDPRRTAWIDGCYARALYATGEHKRGLAYAKDTEAGFATRTFPDDEVLANVRAWIAKK